MKSKKHPIYLILGIIIIVFSICFDFIQKNPFYIGPSQIILMLFGLSILSLHYSMKLFFIIISFNFGILFVVLNSNFFLNIDKSPLIKKNIEKLDESIINNDLSNLERFYLKSQNFIDQTQFVNLLNENYKIKNYSTDLNYKNFDVQNKIPSIKKKIINQYYETHKDILSHNLNIKILNEIKKKKFKILVLEFDALPGIKAIANIYVPLGEQKKFPTVLSVPGCGENLWTDYPDQTDPQHRMELLASNKIVVITSISLCSNSNFTKNHRYEIFKLVADQNLLDTDLAILIWMRIMRFQEEFEFIDHNKLGITGYSYGASIINQILYIDDKIKNVALVGTNLRDIFENENFANFSYERIVESENENYYWSSGPKNLNKSVYNFLKNEDLNENIWRSLLQYDFRKNFYFIFGTNDDSINQGVKRNRLKNINFLNRVNKIDNRDKAIQITENSENHNFSIKNNLLVVKYFKKQFFNDEIIDQSIKIKKNNKNELAPIIHKFDLKKYYVDSFKKKLKYSKLNYNESNTKKILYNNLRLNKLKKELKPILLLNENIELNSKNIETSFFSLIIHENLKSYFYEFTNSKFEGKKINIIISSNLNNLNDIKSIILNGFKTYVLILPGYGISSPRFTTIGNVSKYLLEDKSKPSIAGIAVKSIEHLHEFILKNVNSNNYEYFAYDLESNISLFFYKLIKDNYFNLKSFNFSKNIEEFLNSSENTALPAILFIENLHEIFPIIENIDVEKYNITLNGITDYKKFIFYN